MSAVYLSHENIKRLEDVLKRGHLAEGDDLALECAIRCLRDQRVKRLKHPWNTMNRASIDKTRARKAGK